MITKFGVVSTAATLAVWLFGATPGNASTVTDVFKFTSSTNAVLASGSFSYDSSKSGVLSFADLSAFTINLSGETYDLGFVNGPTATNYEHFGYDTTTNKFVSGDVTGPEGTFHSFLSSINDVSEGFFISSGQTVFEYKTRIGGTYTGYAIAPAATPIPGTLPLLVSAIGGLGFLRWRRKATAAI